MSTAEAQANEGIPSELRLLRCWLRSFGAVAVLCVSSYVVRMASALPLFMEEFADLLKGQPLSALTLFVVYWRRAFLAAAMATPILAILCAAMVRPMRLAVWLLGGLLVVALVEGHLLWLAILVPHQQLVSLLSPK